MLHSLPERWSATVPHDPNEERDPREELDRLLKLAEELLEKSEMYDRRIERSRFMEAGLILTAIGLGIYLAFNPPRDGTTLMITAVGVGVPLLYALAIELILTRQLKRRSRPERAALSEVVSILRETEGAVAARYKWSPFQRAELRIRLSRFGIASERMFQ